MKSTGYVLKSRGYIGSAEPPATVLEDESRFGYIANFESDGHPDWVRLPSGLWVLSFDGNQDFVLFANASDVTERIHDAITILIWINPNSDVAVNDAFISKYGGSGSEQCFTYFIGANNTVAMTIDFGGSLAGTSSNDNAYAEDIWSLLAFTANGTTTQHYSNGVLWSTPQADSGAIKIGSNPLVIGSRYDDGANTFPFPGLIAPPKILNYALSAGQIKKLFEAERHWFGV